MYLYIMLYAYTHVANIISPMGTAAPPTRFARARLQTDMMMMFIIIIILIIVMIAMITMIFMFIAIIAIIIYILKSAAREPPACRLVSGFGLRLDP